MKLSATSERPVFETLVNSFNISRCPKGVGAIEIVARSSRIAARIYVDNHKVYGIEVSNFPLEIIRRIITSEHITDNDRDHLLDVFSHNLSDPKIVDYVLENQMMPASVVITYLKDLFLGACDYIATIPKAEIGWKPNVTPKTTQVPEVELDVLWKIVKRRKEEYDNMAALFTVDSNKVRDLNFKRIDNTETEMTQLTANIYSLATGEWSILDFARQFGISSYLATREIQKLWLNKSMKIIYDGEFVLKAPEISNTAMLEEISYEDAANNYEQSSEATILPAKMFTPDNSDSNENVKDEFEKLKEKFEQLKMLADEALQQLENIQAGKE